MIQNTFIDTFNINKGMAQKQTYQAYGLIIRSELSFPELEPCENKPADVVIRFDKIEKTEEIQNNYRLVKPTKDGILLYWHDVGIFLVRNGCEIIIDPISNVEERIIRLFTLGTTIAMLLHQRSDNIVLHASAVAIDGKAIGFIGDKGAGKSTTSASLHNIGYSLLADDVLAISSKNQVFMALPGFPHFKLWPDSISSLGQTSDTLPKLRPELDKRGFRLRTGFAQKPLILTHIFVLDYGPTVEIAQLTPQKSWKEIMPHWYGARFGENILKHLGLAAHFQQCMALSNNVSIYHLKRPRDLSKLKQFAEMIATFVNSSNGDF